MASYTSEEMIRNELFLIRFRLNRLQKAKEQLNEDYQDALEEKEEQLEDSREQAEESFQNIKAKYNEAIEKLRLEIRRLGIVRDQSAAQIEDLSQQRENDGNRAINERIRELVDKGRMEEAKRIAALRDNDISLEQCKVSNVYSIDRQIDNINRLIDLLTEKRAALTIEQFMSYSQETRLVIEGYDDRKERLDRLIRIYRQDQNTVNSLLLQLERHQDATSVQERLSNLQKARIQQVQEADKEAGEALAQELEQLAEQKFKESTLEYEQVYEQQYEELYQEALLKLYVQRSRGNYSNLGNERAIAEAYAADKLKQQRRKDLLDLSLKISDREARERERVDGLLESIKETFEDSESQYISVPSRQVPVRFFWKDTKDGDEYPARCCQLAFWCFTSGNRFEQTFYYHRNAGNSITNDGELAYAFGHAATNHMGMLTANRHVDTKTEFEQAIGLPDKGRYNIRSNTYQERAFVWKEAPGEDETRLHFAVTNQQDLARMGIETSDGSNGHSRGIEALKEQLSMGEVVSYGGELVNEHINSNARNHQINRLMGLPINHWFNFMPVPSTGVFVTKNYYTHSDSPAYSVNSDEDSLIVKEPTEQTPYHKVYLHCTLPAWSQRIFQLSSEIRKILELMAKDSAVLYHDLSCVQEMKLCNQWNKKFASGNVDSDDLQQKLGLDLALETLDDYIQSALEKPDSYQPSSHIKLRREVNTRARRLMDWLQSDALMAELERYLSHIRKNKESDTLPPGPDMLAESDWPHFFNAVADALSTLAMTDQRDRAAEVLLGPWLDLMAGELDSDIKSMIRTDEVAVELDKQSRASSETEISELLFEAGGDIKELLHSPGRNEDNLLTTMWDTWAEFKGSWGDTLFHRRPGAPSLLQVALDAYGNYVSDRLLNLTGPDASSSMLRFMVNGYGLLVGKDIWVNNTESLSELAVLRRSYTYLGRGKGQVSGVIQRQTFARNVVNASTRRYLNEIGEDLSDTVYNRVSSNPLAKVYGVTVAITGLVGRVTALSALKEELDKAGEDTMSSRQLVSAVHHSLGLAGAGAATYNSVIQRYAWASGLHQKLLGLSDEALAASKVQIANFCDVFATHLGYLAALDSSLQAAELFEEGRDEKAVVATLNAASAFATTLGYQVASRSASVGVGAIAACFIPGIGQVLLVGGLILQVGLLTYELLLPFLQTGIKDRFSGVLDRLERSPYYTDYFDFSGDHIRQANYPDLAAASDIIRKQDENRLFTSIWSELSWRAIIPIYVQQQNAGAKRGELDEQLLEEIIDIINPTVLRIGEGLRPHYFGTVYDLETSDVRELIGFYCSLQIQVDTYEGLGAPPSLPSGKLCQEAMIELENGTYIPHPDDHKDQVWSSRYFRLESQSLLGTERHGTYNQFDNQHQQVTESWFD